MISFTRARGLAVPLLILLAPMSAGQEEATAAQQVLRKVQGLAKVKKWKEAWPLLLELRASKLAEKEVPAQELERLRLRIGVEVVGGAAALHGIVSPLGEGRLQFSCDLSRKVVHEDFEPMVPLPTVQKLKRKGTLLTGTGAYCHLVPFVGDVALEIQGTVRSDHDYGPILIDPDEWDGERFLVGCLDNRFFGTKYGKGRKAIEGHAFLFCGRGAESKSRSRPTQLYALSSKPYLRRGHKTTFGLAWQARHVVFSIGKTELTFDVKSSQVIKRKRAGLFLRQSAFDLQKVTITGRPDPEWMAYEEGEIRKRL